MTPKRIFSHMKLLRFYGFKINRFGRFIAGFKILFDEEEDEEREKRMRNSIFAE
jgi:hypothetical protein